MRNLDINFDGRTESVEIYNIDDFPYTKYVDTQLVNSNRMTYYNLSATFDIESTTVRNTCQHFDDEKTHYIGFMYIWQFCLHDTVCIGRTWEEFQEFLERL